MFSSSNFLLYNLPKILYELDEINNSYPDMCESVVYKQMNPLTRAREVTRIYYIESDQCRGFTVHLWFVTLHPFEDGNGRIARTIADMQLTRADKILQRFYSMSAQIQLERKPYYDILKKNDQ